MLHSNKAWLLSLITGSVLLAGCGSSDNKSMDTMTEKKAYLYQVTVTNLTHNQPLSPVAVLLHSEQKLWQVGQAASVELEQLAEGGDNTQFLTLANNSASSAAVLMPGQSTQVSISSTDLDSLYLTISTMLVNTNDAFAGLTGWNVTNLAVGDSMSMTAAIYDAGTEANSEMAGTIPGPADGGTGFDSGRDDVNFVARHPGVVSQDDGLSSSVLNQSHRFDNPTVHFSVSRMQ